MIDLGQFPSPADAPEPGARIRVEAPRRPRGRRFDAPHRSLVLDALLLRDLDAVLTGSRGTRR